MDLQNFLQDRGWTDSVGLCCYKAMLLSEFCLLQISPGVSLLWVDPAEDLYQTQRPHDESPGLWNHNPNQTSPHGKGLFGGNPVTAIETWIKTKSGPMDSSYSEVFLLPAPQNIVRNQIPAHHNLNGISKQPSRQKQGNASLLYERRFHKEDTWDSKHCGKVWLNGFHQIKNWQSPKDIR